MKKEQQKTTKHKIPQVVALKYEGKGAPLVTAKGKGEIAEQLLAIAKEHSIPLYQNKELTELLAKVKLGDEIPEKLYQAVAKVLYFVYLLNGQDIPQAPVDNSASSNNEGISTSND